MKPFYTTLVVLFLLVPTARAELPIATRSFLGTIANTAVIAVTFATLDSQGKCGACMSDCQANGSWFLGEGQLYQWCLYQTCSTQCAPIIDYLNQLASANPVAAPPAEPPPIGIKGGMPDPGADPWPPGGVGAPRPPGTGPLIGRGPGFDDPPGPDPEEPQNVPANFSSLAPLEGPVCVFMDKGSPAVGLPLPEDFTAYVTNDLADMLKQCKNIADGACSGAVIMDGHASAIGKYFEPWANGDVLTSVHNDANFTGLKECLDRISGSNQVNLYVTACAGWSNESARPAIAHVLDRPLIAVASGCAYYDPQSFAMTDGTWKYYLPGFLPVLNWPGVIVTE